MPAERPVATKGRVGRLNSGSYGSNGHNPFRGLCEGIHPEPVEMFVSTPDRRRLRTHLRMDHVRSSESRWVPVRWDLVAFEFVPVVPGLPEPVTKIRILVPFS